MVCSWRVKTVNYKSTEEDKCQWNDKHLLMKLKQGPAFFFLSDSGGMFFFLRKCGPDDKILDQSDGTSCFCRVRTGA